MARIRHVTALKRTIVLMGKFEPEKASGNVREMKKPVGNQPVCPMCKCAARTAKAGWEDEGLGITRDTRLFSAHARGGKRLKPGEFPCPGSYRVAE